MTSFRSNTTTSTHETFTYFRSTLGLPFVPGAFLGVTIFLSFCIAIMALVMAIRSLELRTIPTNLLWTLYYIVGFVFHLGSW